MPLVQENGNENEAAPLLGESAERELIVEPRMESSAVSPDGDISGVRVTARAKPRRSLSRVTEETHAEVGEKEDDALTIIEEYEHRMGETEKAGSADGVTGSARDSEHSVSTRGSGSVATVTVTASASCSLESGTQSGSPTASPTGTVTATQSECEFEEGEYEREQEAADAGLMQDEDWVL